MIAYQFYKKFSICNVIIRAGEPEPGVFSSLEPEPLEEKKQEPELLGKKSGAGAAKKLAGSSALREDRNCT